MKIRVIKALVDGVYKSAVSCEDFSEADINLMSEFGQPEIDIGGVFLLSGTPASQVGTVDMSTGADWTSDNRVVSFAFKGGTATCRLDTLCVDAAAVANRINEQLAVVAPSILGMRVSASPAGILTASSTGKGQTYSLSIVDVANSAYAQIGWTPSVAYGSGPDDFYKTPDLRRIRLDSPFLAAFDSRDLGDVGAQASADGWTTTVTARIKSSMAVLRGHSDVYAGESLETYNG
jgi:hypothetical protein